MAGTVLRNGPANGWRMEPTMKRLEIQPWAAIHLPFLRTARRSVPAIAQYSDWFRVKLAEIPGGAILAKLEIISLTSTRRLGHSVPVTGILIR